MTGSAPLLAVVLLAILAGAAIPVLYQLYQVLIRARAMLDTAGPRLERTLDQMGQAAERFNAIGSTLDAHSQAITPLLEATSWLARSMIRSGTWLGTAMTIGTGFGSAVKAGVRAFFKGTDVRPRTDAHPAAFEHTRDEVT